METQPVNTLQDILREVRDKRSFEKKPLAIALCDALAEPVPEDMLESLSETPTADEWRKMIGSMAKPRRDESSLEAGARTIARQFVQGDKDAAKMVREAVDGRPDSAEAQAAAIAGAVSGAATAVLVARLEDSLLRLAPGVSIVDAKAVEIERK